MESSVFILEWILRFILYSKEESFDEKKTLSPWQLLKNFFKKRSIDWTFLSLITNTCLFKSRADTHTTVFPSWAAVHWEKSHILIIKTENWSCNTSEFSSQSTMLKMHVVWREKVKEKVSERFNGDSRWNIFNRLLEHHKNEALKKTSGFSEQPNPCSDKLWPFYIMWP